MLGQYRYQAVNLTQHGPNHADFPEFLAFETSSAHSLAKLGHVQKLGRILSTRQKFISPKPLNEGYERKSVLGLSEMAKDDLNSLTHGVTITFANMWADAI